MSEMVERVAEALFIAKFRREPHFDYQDSLEKDEWRLMAKLVIQAMRAPSDEMCKSGAAKWDDDLCTETNALNMYEAMIDEALKG